jgi:hemerythrin-like metal-binding protein
MQVMPWSNAFSVGVKDIDNQHRQLVDILNRLGELAQNHAGGADTQPVLNELLQYTVTHFGFEEGLMRQIGYAQYDSHLREHQDLIRQVQVLAQHEAGPNGPQVQELVILVRDWLTSHIMGTDRAFGLELNRRGIR